MDLLFRIIYAAHANGTHHKLALDALRDLHGDHAEGWRRLVLEHVRVYLEGSKAPDKEFKDFRNHVLHTRDGYWGGAPEKARNWYEHLVSCLREQNWSAAVYSAGVLSHYYTDPIHPFHTAQSEAENNIHRAVEWTISKSYDALRLRGLAEPQDTITVGTGPSWLADLLVAGAERANSQYEKLIAHYDFECGVVRPEEGFDSTGQTEVARLLVYAARSFAIVLSRAFAEAGIAPPRVELTTDTVLATLQIPLKWIQRKLADAEDRRIVEAMYDELKASGRVEATLPEDDRAVRDTYRKEVLEPRSRLENAERQSRLSASRVGVRAERTSAAHLPAGPGRVTLVHPPAVGTPDSGTVAPAPAPRGSSLMDRLSMPVTPPLAAPPQRAPETAGLLPTTVGATATASTGPSVPIIPAVREPRSGSTSRVPDHTVPAATQGPAPAPPAVEPAPTAAVDRTGSPKRLLALDDDVEAAPSIGPKTAERLTFAGVRTVGDLLAADAEALAARVGQRHITAVLVRDWQHQARLATTIAGLSSAGAQLLVGAGYHSAHAIGAAQSDELLVAILKYAATAEGQRVLRHGSPPDVEKITRWIQDARASKAA